MKKEHVLIVCNSYPPEIGGAPSRIAHLARLLADNGFRVTVITAMPNYPYGAILPGWGGRLTHKQVEEGITVRRYWLIPSNRTGFLRRGISLLSWALSLFFLAGLRIAFTRRKHTIISTPPLPGAAAAAVATLLGRKKFLLNVSDLWPQTGVEMGLVREGPALSMLRGVERWLYRKATAWSVQSGEIARHLQEVSGQQKPVFLYRNLPATGRAGEPRPANRPLRLLYAGVLGSAQDLLGISRAIDFAGLGAELHIYGNGRQRNELKAFLAEHPRRGILLNDAVSAAEMERITPAFDAALIPLAMPIKGAVPSKLFSSMHAGMPVFFCGGGEGAALTAEHTLGWVSPPGDHAALAAHVEAFARMDGDALRALRMHVLHVARTQFSREEQDGRFLHFLRTH